MTCVRLIPRLLLAGSVLVAGLAPMTPTPVRAQSLLEQLFGPPTVEHRRKIRQSAPRKTYKRKAVRQKRSARRSAAPRSSRSASRGAGAAPAGSSYTYRTLCVRKADGYFFPVSFSTTTTYFDRDLEACEARCPGTEVDLYFHRVLREEAEQMVSHTTGKDYTDLATAFAYKTEGVDAVAAKACELKPEPAPGMRIAEDLGDLPFVSPIPIPVGRPDLESILVSELRDGDQALAEVSGRPKPIRQVGPRFFPDQ
ncbi:DUF2865 domain-containing protein [Fulvimarina sp. 2208YS6-2-32]|uniref:DUF2865 domain-containing protein n=1 Tax=Fulvimarina uroteuthidis TaxID=3098149 RepID=A0ABU5I4C7_9HYPH|nr:DUF2865 domain-containing protein [Fulvimarina sp. 2208YS6-2-32]